MGNIITKEILNNSSNIIKQKKDIGFFNRVWATDINVYLDRIKSIGMYNLESVLDAGCGKGYKAA